MRAWSLILIWTLLSLRWNSVNVLQLWISAVIHCGWKVRRPIRNDTKIFTKTEKNIFKIRKSISNRDDFGNHRWRVYQIWKPLQILIQLLNPQILFCKSQTSLQIQRLSLNPEKYFANPIFLQAKFTLYTIWYIILITLFSLHHIENKIVVPYISSVLLWLFHAFYPCSCVDATFFF